MKKSSIVCKKPSLNKKFAQATLASVIATTMLLTTACNNSENSDKKDTADWKTLVAPAKTVNEFTGTELLTKLKEIDPIAHSHAPIAKCDVVVKKFTYRTHGVKAEDTTATAALIVPKGDSAECKGDRPVLLWAHGTSFRKLYDFSQVGNPGNPAGSSATDIAASFAAQGYIVVAPNYAGYDESDLSYHPYLNAKQQSHEMADALLAARDSIKSDTDSKKTTDSGKLFISGYSQGGHVALATAKHFESIGEKVTAVAPMSGPYAMAAFGDMIFGGVVNAGATIFAPLIAVNYNKDYGNIYNSPSDFINEKYATNFDTLLPVNLVVVGKDFANALPESALFQSETGERKYGFHKTDYLMKTSFRQAYLQDAAANPDGYKNTSYLAPATPAHPLRQALKINDLRSYMPKSPVMLCGGNQDPMVFFDINTNLISNVWQQQSDIGTSLNVVVLDVDTTNATDRTNPSVTYIGDAQKFKAKLDPVFTKAQSEFKADFMSIASQGNVEKTMGSYHSTLTAPSCLTGTRAYFKQF